MPDEDSYVCGVTVSLQLLSAPLKRGTTFSHMNKTVAVVKSAALGDDAVP